MPSDEEFRAAGFTSTAKNFPLSDAARRWLAAFNGISVETMPRAWCYAPNAYMLDVCERHGAKLEKAQAPGERGDG